MLLIFLRSTGLGDRGVAEEGQCVDIPDPYWVREFISSGRAIACPGESAPEPPKALTTIEAPAAKPTKRGKP